jgi:predicted ArsR family transcriptional regulator
MLQLSIFDSAPAARRTDPRTSHEAAASAKDLQARHHRIILACLRDHGPASKDRIASLTNLTGTQVARRTTELERAGLIRDTGDKARSTAGRAERVWKTT